MKVHYIEDVNNNLTKSENNIIDDLTDIISSAKNTYVKDIKITTIDSVGTELVKINAVHKNGFISYRKDYVYTIRYNDVGPSIRTGLQSTTKGPLNEDSLH